MEYLQDSSRGWFEEDDVFESRVHASHKELARQHGSIAKRKGNSKASTSTIHATTRVSGKNSKWVTPGSQGYGGKLGGKKKTKRQGGSLFGAMVMDDSSDEDSSDDDDTTTIRRKLPLHQVVILYLP